MDTAHIRNFSIIAHIDHGKSTLADRMLELTGTIEKRKMKEQVLDMMDLERERGITIKMQPVRMQYKQKLGDLPTSNSYELNLIDTPGHIDFSYEVSRALQAVEGAILLVDATQGVQAQTLTTLRTAQALGVKIIPVINKIDLAVAQVEEVKAEIIELLHCEEKDILAASGKTGAGVLEILDAVIERVPAPQSDVGKDPPLPEAEERPFPLNSSRSLVFDFEYDIHAGLIVYVRVIDGMIHKKDALAFIAGKDQFTVLELGIFSPQKKPCEMLSPGEIGYLVTGIKKTGAARVGDTITTASRPLAPLPGYSEPRPVVWASVYPENQDDFMTLRQALERLRLQDSALSFEEEAAGAVGRGFRCGFLGMLHLEIISERLRREFNLELIITSPTISYEIQRTNGTREKVYSATAFPEESQIEKVYERWVDAQIITPPEYMGSLVQLFHEHEATVVNTEIFGDHRTALSIQIPLRELMRNFFDEIKSVTSGYASIAYTFADMREADVIKVEVLIADEVVPAFSRIVSRARLQKEAEEIVEKIKNVIPRQMFDFKIQAKAGGRILSSRHLSGMKKDVTDYLYGGDITRKMKLREKQKKGKKKMKAMGVVNIPHDVFLKVMK
ncbi:MAG: translation elongation factor 4 [Candidatus Paceibacterota bacterium]|jgi:GTP-binding protein LepA